MADRFDKDIIKKSFSKAAKSYDSSSALQISVAEDLLTFLGGIAYFGREPACAGSISNRMRKKSFPDFFRYGLPEVNSCKPHKLLDFQVSQFGNPSMGIAGCVFPQPAKGIPQAAPAYEAHILDIGCGTGRLTGGVKSLFREVRLCAADIAFPMLMKARQNLCDEEVMLVQADCESLPFEDSAFDIVASSLTYQWAPDVFLAFREAGRVLKKNGLLIFSTLGPDTLRELRECYRVAKSGYTHFMAFKSPDALALTLRKAGFNVEAMERRLASISYENLRALIRTLRNTGASPASPPVDAVKKGLSSGSALRRAEKIYTERYTSENGEGVQTTYEVIFAAARKD